ILLRSGQLSFGLAGFFGLGSYASVLLSLNTPVSGLLSILFAGLFTGAAAFLLGKVILRLRGMYFAIATLALGEIFRVIIRNWKGFAGGPEGKILPSVIFDGAPWPSYLLTLSLVLAVIGVSELVQHSRYRFGLTAIRNNEIVAMSRGIDVPNTLNHVFSISAALMGAAGAVFANLYGFVTPENTFSADYTLLPLAMALLGGIYGTWGPVVGALILGVVAEYLKLFIPYGHLIVYGIIIILVILFMPRGFVGLFGDLLAHRRYGKDAGDSKEAAA
ncbi:MAG: branched-chain amino acid ABC transporter permease, partial [Spirochaetaceae bacterium]|nr:branched-chain amino acid ABC transporter permease [Spirochaetaceae bacterium]